MMYTFLIQLRLRVKWMHEVVYTVHDFVLRNQNKKSQYNSSIFSLNKLQEETQTTMEALNQLRVRNDDDAELAGREDKGKERGRRST